MRHKRLRINAVLLLGLGLSGLQAQESFNALGGDASTGGGTVSFSIGQVFLQEKAGGNEIVLEGVQQPYEISVLTSTKEAMDHFLLFHVFPNPTMNYLNLESKEFELSNCFYELFDLTGKTIMKEQIKSNMTTINMSNLVPTTYFVKIRQEDNIIKTFKVVKK